MDLRGFWVFPIKCYISFMREIRSRRLGAIDRKRAHDGTKTERDGMSMPSLCIEKTKRAAHYVISHSEPARLGATKLNKVLWKADILHMRRYGRTISGQDSYNRLPKGPAPNGMVQVLRELKAEAKILERRVETPRGIRRQFLDIERLGPIGFEATEIEAIHEAIDLICPLSAEQASDATHDTLWEAIDNGEQIPVRAACVTPTSLTDEELEWALKAELAD